MMTISELYVEMLNYPESTMHDRNHLTKVWAYAKTIGELERLDTKTQYTLEASAIMHDIACPRLHILYGEANGKKQEELGPSLAKEFLKNKDIPQDIKERIIYLIGHHHTPDKIYGIDYQILIEADYLVNADESSYPKESIKKMYDTYFKTIMGKELLKDLYLND